MLKYLFIPQAQRYTYIVAVILLLSKVILLYSCCAENGLVYVAIVAPFSRQPFFYFKCTSLNMRSSYNV